MTDQTLDVALAAARVAFAFGQVRRVTRHPDGELESDSTHAVMLSLLAIGAATRAGLDPGLAAAFAVVHDLPETYGGDTDTSRELSPEEAADKARREAEGLERVCAELAGPVADLLRRYEAQAEPEARLVRVLDKVTPKLAHLLNGGASFVALGLTAEHVRANHARQRARLAAEYPEPALAPAHVLLAAACETVERGLADGTVRASADGRPAPGPRAIEVLFYPGTGGGERLPVAYVSRYPRGPGGRCAFCHGDPTCEESLPDSPIARYFAAVPHASSCPVCDGRPS